MNRKQRRAAAAKDRQKPTGYLEKMLAEGLRLSEQMGGVGVGHVFVQHDSWCDLLNGRGDCNCYPDVTSRPDRVS